MKQIALLNFELPQQMSLLFILFRRGRLNVICIFAKSMRWTDADSLLSRRTLVVRVVTTVQMSRNSRAAPGRIARPSKK